MIKYYFFRHGEVDNPRKVLYGRLPRFGLSEKGKKEASKTAEKLKDKKIDIIYSSPMLRARQTAQILSKKFHSRIKISKLLTEVNLLHEGMDLGMYKNKYQPFIYSEKYIKKGQESVRQVLKRMKKFLKITNKAHQGKTIGVVSHGDPIVILKAAFENKEFNWKYKKNNYVPTGGYIKIICDLEECRIF